MASVTPSPRRAITKRLLAAGIPIEGVEGNSAATARIVYLPEATQTQRTAGDAILAEWDVEQAAIDAAEGDQRSFPERIIARRQKCLEDVAAIEASGSLNATQYRTLVNNILTRMLNSEAAHLKYHLIQLRGRAD